MLFIKGLHVAIRNKIIEYIIFYYKKKKSYTKNLYWKPQLFPKNKLEINILAHKVQKS